MGEHSLDEPTNPAVPTEPPPPPKTIERKLVVATVAATVLYAVGNAVQDNTALLDGLPPWARGLILAVLPTLLAFLAGYQTPSNRI